jgi:hypothetical protein
LGDKRSRQRGSDPGQGAKRKARRVRVERGDQLAPDKLILAVAGKVVLENVPQAIDWSAPLGLRELAKERHLMVNQRLTLTCDKRD